MPPVDAAPSGSTRATPRALLILAAALLVLRVATGVREHAHPPAAVEKVAWRPIAEGEAIARAGGRPILYDFTAEWCAPCRLLGHEVFADPHSAEWINRSFVPVRVLDRTREEGRNPAAVDTLQRRYHVQAFPTLVVVPPRGGEPETIEGYPGAREVMKRLSEAWARARVGAPRAGGPTVRFGGGGGDSAGAAGR